MSDIKFTTEVNLGNVLLYYTINDINNLDNIAIKMLEYQEPKFLIPFKTNYYNDIVTVKYEVKRYISLDNYILSPMNVSDCATLFLGLSTPFSECSDWLLDINKFYLNLSNVYYDSATKSIKYTYIPNLSYINDMSVKDFFQLVASKIKKSSNIDSFINEVIAMTVDINFSMEDFVAYCRSVISGSTDNIPMSTQAKVPEIPRNEEIYTPPVSQTPQVPIIPHVSQNQNAHEFPQFGVNHQEKSKAKEKDKNSQKTPKNSPYININDNNLEYNFPNDKDNATNDGMINKAKKFFGGIFNKEKASSEDNSKMLLDSNLLDNNLFNTPATPINNTPTPNQTPNEYMNIDRTNVVPDVTDIMDLRTNVQKNKIDTSNTDIDMILSLVNSNIDDVPQTISIKLLNNDNYYILGRNDFVNDATRNNIALSSISKTHVKFENIGSSYTITDISYSNYVYVDNVEIAKNIRKEIVVNNLITLGADTVTYRITYLRQD